MPTPEPEAPESEEEESATDAEFRALHVGMTEEQDRLRGIATTASPEIAHLYRETVAVIEGMKDLAVATCAALRDAEIRLEDLEDDTEGPTESVLLEEDAKAFTTVFQQNILFLEQAVAAIDAGPQKEVLAALLRTNQDLLERVKEIAVEEEEEEEEGGGEDDDGDEDD